MLLQISQWLSHIYGYELERALSTVACTFEFTNRDDGTYMYYLLKRNTPLDGFYSPFITVSRDGVPVQYEGIIAHYAPFSKNKFVPLRVGESIIATVQHTDAFTFSSDGNLCSSIAGYIRR